MRPNLIWIFGDQHRAQAMGSTGDPNVRTPNLDAMGSRWRTGVGGIPLCTPFRGALLTSQYPHRCIPNHDGALPDGARTVATAFNGAGYDTAYYGKWHVDGRANRDAETRPVFHHVRPERRGDFRTWIGYENNNSQYDCYVHGHRANGDGVDRYKLAGYETDALTDLLIEDLTHRKTGEPFFAALSVQPPHSPYVAPPEFESRYSAEDIVLRPNVPPVKRIQDAARESLAGYYAMIENLDWNVGRVLQTLSATGLADTTYVIFFADHGDMHGSQARILKCVPWEESIRIPFIVHGPGAGAGRMSPELINHVDIAPTSLGLCGIEAPGWMVGTNYANSYLPDKDVAESVPDSAYLQLIDPGWVYGYATDRERPWRGVVTADGWKYAALEGQPWLLYNLNDDPYETANLALDRRYKAERERLQSRLHDWIFSTGDTFILPDIS